MANALPMNQLGSRLLILRGLAGGISQREFAHLADVSPGYPGIIERADSELEISAVVARRMAGVFDCDLDYLISGEGAPPDAAHVQAAVALARVAAKARDDARKGAA